MLLVVSHYAPFFAEFRNYKKNYKIIKKWYRMIMKCKTDCLSCVVRVCSSVRWTSWQDLSESRNIWRTVRTCWYKAVHAGSILLRTFQVDTGTVVRCNWSSVSVLLSFFIGGSFCSDWSWSCIMQRATLAQKIKLPHSNVCKPLNDLIAWQEAMTRKQNMRVMHNSVGCWKAELY